MVIHQVHDRQHQKFQLMKVLFQRNEIVFLLQFSLFFVFQVNPIRTVTWSELLPKITINIDPNRFHSTSTGRKNPPHKKT